MSQAWFCEKHGIGGANASAACPACYESVRMAEAAKALSMALDRKDASLQAGEGAGSVSDGSTASYYELPDGATELQHLISHRNMNAQIGEIFRACYRYGQASHSPQLRDAKKIKFYIEAEIARLESKPC